jgi:hypothetical protein
VGAQKDVFPYQPWYFSVSQETEGWNGTSLSTQGKLKETIVRNAVEEEKG